MYEEEARNIHEDDRLPENPQEAAQMVVSYLRRILYTLWFTIIVLCVLTVILAYTT